MLAKSPSAVRVMDGPAPIFCEALAGIVAKAIRMAPFVACFVSAATYDGADTVSAAEAMFHSLGGGHVIHNVGVHAPCVMVGDLFETVGVALAHIVAGNADICEVDARAHLGFTHIFAHISGIDISVCGAGAFGMYIVDYAATDHHAVEFCVGVARHDEFGYGQGLKIICGGKDGIIEREMIRVLVDVCEHAES